MELEGMSPKRRRLSPAPSGEGILDQLPDSAIEEILLRLPLSSVFGSRSVSKLWHSLTTSPYFIQRWELHHAPFHQDPPLVLLLQNSYTCTERNFFLCSGVPQVKLSGLSLDFLPGFRLNGNDPITVMGSCQDLLLCCNRERFQSDYFVVNPITRQWVALPPTLRLHRSVLVSFVCEPASVAGARKGGEVRYRVVRIPVFEGSRTEFNVEIFSSEDGQWNEYAITLPEGLRTQSWSERGVACSGIVYWQSDVGGVNVIGLDPFNPKEIEIRIIQNMPDTLDIEPKKYVLGTCRGKLKMSQMLWSEDTPDGALRVNIWELENGEAKWRLVKVVPLLEIQAANPSIVHPTTAGSSSCRTLAFHPNDEDIIYLECTGMNKVICCNSKKMSLEIVSGYDLNKSFRRCADAFPLVLPLWPTPIPPLL